MFEPELAHSNEPRISVLASLLHRALATLAHGTLISYARLREIIFEDPQGWRGRAVVLKARDLLLADDRYLVNVRGVGYQIAYPREHAGQSRKQAGFGLRRLRKAVKIVVATDVAQLTAGERQQLNEQTNRARLQLALSTRLQRTPRLPALPATSMPSGRELAALLRRRGRSKQKEADDATVRGSDLGEADEERSGRRRE